VEHQVKADGMTICKFPNRCGRRVAGVSERRANLATAGAGWGMLSTSILTMLEGSQVNDVMVGLYRHYMPNHAPIWTQVGVAALGLPTMRIEIRVTAIVL